MNSILKSPGKFCLSSVASDNTKQRPSKKDLLKKFLFLLLKLRSFLLLQDSFINLLNPDEGGMILRNVDSKVL